MMWNILSCKRHTELASHQLDRSLSLSERVQYFAHHVICLMCRRFERQLAIIQRTAKAVLTEPNAPEKLSDEAKERIRQNLHS